MNTPAAEPMKIAIYGPYKTGTTSLFYRVSRSLTGDVRTLFEPRQYLPEAGDESRHVVAKVMLVMPDAEAPVRFDTFECFDRKLYLTRDPRDWLVSGTLFLTQQTPALYRDEARLSAVLEMLRQKERVPASVSVTAVLEEILKSIPGASLETLGTWMHRYHRWLISFEGALINAHRVKYEDCVDGNLGGVARYLGLSLSGDAEVAPEHDHVPRTRTHGEWRNWLLPEDVAWCAPIFTPYLEHYGYESDWSLNAARQIDPQHCSLYVERTVNKRKTVDRSAS